MQNYVGAFYFGEFKRHGLNAGLISRHDLSIHNKCWRKNASFFSFSAIIRQVSVVKYTNNNNKQNTKSGGLVMSQSQVFNTNDNYGKLL